MAYRVPRGGVSEVLSERGANNMQTTVFIRVPSGARMGCSYCFFADLVVSGRYIFCMHSLVKGPTIPLPLTDIPCSVLHSSKALWIKDHRARLYGRAPCTDSLPMVDVQPRESCPPYTHKKHSMKDQQATGLLNPTRDRN